MRFVLVDEFPGNHNHSETSKAYCVECTRAACITTYIHCTEQVHQAETAV